MTKLFSLLFVGLLAMFYPNEVRAQEAASAPEGVIATAEQNNQNQQNRENQQAQAKPEPNTPPAVQRAEADVKRAASRFNLGVQGGAGLDPEIVDLGVHASFGSVFSNSLSFRPGFEVGAGELTTLFAANLDVLYTLPGITSDTRWMPYVGAGPQFGLSHQGFETDDLSKVNVDGVTIIDDRTVDRNRFDFSDTDFNTGLNFIVGMRRQSGAFFEMKATAWGVSSIRLLAGFNFLGWGGSPR